MKFTKEIHEKLSLSIQEMIANRKLNLPFYGHFNTYLNFIEVKDDDRRIQTCAVNVTARGMNFYYNKKFLNRLSQEAVNFVVIHEDFHLLFNHQKRTIMGNFNHEISNVVQDMIINHLILEEIPSFFVEIPKDSKGRNMGLLVPKEYTGRLIFEELYMWMMDKKKEREEQRNKNQSGGQNGNQEDNQGDGDSDMDSSGKPAYGPYGKNPRRDNGNGKSNQSDTIDTYSLDKILDDIENGGNGSYMDSHIEDEVSSEEREGRVDSIIQAARNRGLTTGGIDGTLEKLRPKKKDHLREIKKTLSNGAFGLKKLNTIRKPNRKGISGVKGFKKVNTEINVILDVSGSMSGGLIEKTLAYVYKQDVVINMIQADTQVNKVERYTRTAKIQDMKITGYGGTVLMPAIEFVANDPRLNKFATVILTDGYCDTLDTSGLSKKTLIISCGARVSMYKSNGKTKQIMVDEN